MVRCQRCTYYYVTWIQVQPHGCKAYGFRSKKLPSMVVKQSSGKECMFFKDKGTSKCN
jgi:hypothetical protein